MQMKTARKDRNQKSQIAYCSAAHNKFRHPCPNRIATLADGLPQTPTSVPKKKAYRLFFESQYCVYGSTDWEIPSSFQRSKRYAQSPNGAERQPFLGLLDLGFASPCLAANYQNQQSELL